MTSRYKRFVKAGLELASAAHRDAECYYQLAALIVRKNRVLAVGYNNPKTHPLAKTKMKQLHAECSAIIKCNPIDLYGSEIVVVRARRDGKVGMARPCMACARLIKQTGLKRVHYTIDAPDANDPLFLSLDVSEL